MKKLGKVDVVGIPYTIYLYNDEFKLLNEHATERDNRYNQKTQDKGPLDGYCDYMSKEIRVFGDEYTSPDYFEMTLRHEITHAFLYEIGNSNCDDEDYIDKISKWVPQINKIFDAGMELIVNARTEEE